MTLVPLLAQCAMCSLSRGEGADLAWLAGALVLLVPAAAIIGGIGRAAWRHRK